MTVVGETVPRGNAPAVAGAGRHHEPITPGQTKKRSSHTSNQFAELDAHNSGKKRSATEAPGGEFIRIPPFRPSGTFPRKGGRKKFIRLRAERALATLISCPASQARIIGQKSGYAAGGMGYVAVEKVSLFSAQGSHSKGLAALPSKSGVAGCKIYDRE